MAKGFNTRGMGGMGGMGGNMNNMIRQAQKMQQDMMKAQEELESKTYEAAAGGGVVTAVVSGKKELTQVTIGGERGPAKGCRRCRQPDVPPHRRPGTAVLIHTTLKGCFLTREQP